VSIDLNLAITKCKSKILSSHWIHKEEQATKVIILQSQNFINLVIIVIKTKKKKKEVRSQFREVQILIKTEEVSTVCHRTDSQGWLKSRLDSRLRKKSRTL